MKRQYLKVFALTLSLMGALGETALGVSSHQLRQEAEDLRSRLASLQESADEAAQRASTLEQTWASTQSKLGPLQALLNQSDRIGRAYEQTFDATLSKRRAFAEDLEHHQQAFSEPHVSSSSAGEAPSLSAHQELEFSHQSAAYEAEAPSHFEAEMPSRSRGEADPFDSRELDCLPVDQQCEAECEFRPHAAAKPAWQEAAEPADLLNTTHFPHIARGEVHFFVNQDEGPVFLAFETPRRGGVDGYTWTTVGGLWDSAKEEMSMDCAWPTLRDRLEAMCASVRTQTNSLIGFQPEALKEAYHTYNTDKGSLSFFYDLSPLIGEYGNYRSLSQLIAQLNEAVQSTGIRSVGFVKAEDLLASIRMYQPSQPFAPVLNVSRYGAATDVVQTQGVLDGSLVTSLNTPETEKTARAEGLFYTNGGLGLIEALDLLGKEAGSGTAIPRLAAQVDHLQAQLQEAAQARAQLLQFLSETQAELETKDAEVRQAAIEEEARASVTPQTFAVDHGNGVRVDSFKVIPSENPYPILRISAPQGHYLSAGLQVHLPGEQRMRTIVICNHVGDNTYDVGLSGPLWKPSENTQMDDSASHNFSGDRAEQSPGQYLECTSYQDMPALSQYAAADMDDEGTDASASGSTPSIMIYGVDHEHIDHTGVDFIDWGWANGIAKVSEPGITTLLLHNTAGTRGYFAPNTQLVFLVEDQRVKATVARQSVEDKFLYVHAAGDLGILRENPNWEVYREDDAPRTGPIVNIPESFTKVFELERLNLSLNIAFPGTVIEGHAASALRIGQSVLIPGDSQLRFIMKTTASPEGPSAVCEEVGSSILCSPDVGHTVQVFEIDPAQPTPQLMRWTSAQMNQSIARDGSYFCLLSTTGNLDLLATYPTLRFDMGQTQHTCKVTEWKEKGDFVHVYVEPPFQGVDDLISPPSFEPLHTVTVTSDSAVVRNGFFTADDHSLLLPVSTQEPNFTYQGSTLTLFDGLGGSIKAAIESVLGIQPLNAVLVRLNQSVGEARHWVNTNIEVTESQTYPGMEIESASESSASAASQQSALRHSQRSNVAS